MVISGGSKNESTNAVLGFNILLDWKYRDVYWKKTSNENRGIVGIRDRKSVHLGVMDQEKPSEKL